MLQLSLFKRPLLLLGAVTIVLSASQVYSKAEDTSPSPSAAATIAPAAPAASPAAAASPAPSASPAVSPPGSVEDRLASLEAYIHNTDGSKTLPGTSGPGHNAWQMASSALVLFMTLPGLALFYGGLVRRKNALSVLAQCFGITGLVVVLWWICGYSLVFGKNFNNPFFGGSEYFFLSGVNSVPNGDYAYWVSQNVYAMYQLMFAIITPALIVGSIAERMKYTLDVCRLFSVGPYGLGNNGLYEWNLECEFHHQSHRLCRRDRGAYELWMERLDSLSHPWAANWIQERADGASQHGTVYGWNRHALGGMVRL
jgi:hypothetical protein